MNILDGFFFLYYNIYIKRKELTLKFTGKEFKALMQHCKEGMGVFEYPILMDDRLFFTDSYFAISASAPFSESDISTSTKSNSVLVLRFDVKIKVLVKDEILIDTSGIYLNNEKIGSWESMEVSARPQLTTLFEEVQSMAGKLNEDESSFYFAYHALSDFCLKNISDTANAFKCRVRLIPCCKKKDNGRFTVPVLYCEYRTSSSDPICGTYAPLRFKENLND